MWTKWILKFERKYFKMNTKKITASAVYEVIILCFTAEYYNETVSSLCVKTLKNGASHKLANR